MTKGANLLVSEITCLHRQIVVLFLVFWETVNIKMYQMDKRMIQMIEWMKIDK